MRIFITGATGFIGSAVVRELMSSGHQVIGLCRSDDKAAALAGAGATVHRGSLEDTDSLRAGAARSDGVIHLAFNHDFSRYQDNCDDDRRVIESLGAALAGTGRPLIVTSGTALTRTAPGRAAREDDPAASSSVMPRAASEEAAAAVAAMGINVSIVRLPQVHDTARQGLITYLIATARERGSLAYIGDGGNRWPAAHVDDVARLYRLAIEKAVPGAKYHAVAEEGVAMRDIVETLARRLALPIEAITPAEAETRFGWMAHLVARDLPTSSEQTRRTLGWQPTGPRLLADLARLAEM